LIKLKDLKLIELETAQEFKDNISIDRLKKEIFKLEEL
jgi:hypothetical protein